MFKVNGLPSHWRRGRVIAALIVFVSALAVALLGSQVQGVERSDATWLSVRFTARERLHPPTAPDPDIVLVQMDDRSVDKWPEPIIAWGPHLADALNHLTDGGARVVGLDWIQPISTARWFPGYDEKLEKALNRAGNVVLVKELRSGSNGAADKWIRPSASLLFALPDSDQDPEAHLGYAELGQDSVSTAVSPALPGPGAPEMSFGGRVVERYLGRTAQVAPGHWKIAGSLDVPLREDGTLPLNYAGFPGESRCFRRYSLYDVADPARPFPDAQFRGKIVIIGASYRGYNDLHYVPFLKSLALADLSSSRKVPGMEIQANLVRTLLHARPIGEPGPVARWLLPLGLGLIGLAAFSYLPWGRAALVAVVAAVCWIIFSLVLFVWRDYALPASLPLATLLLTCAMMGGYRALGEERERAQVMKVWGRYQDPRVVDYALAHPELRGGQGLEVEATVLFADLKDFTKTVEALAPGEALRHLNRYLSAISEVVLEHGGLVDKYLGDGLMAQWGVPQPQSDHAGRAVRACLELQRRVGAMKANAAADEVGFGLRLTLHTGPVVAGNVGSESRLEYTIIGDTVNVTSRLQETAKQLDCEFLISESTYHEVQRWVVTGKQGQVEIRGRRQPLRVYEVVDTTPGWQGEAA